MKKYFALSFFFFASLQLYSQNFKIYKPDSDFVQTVLAEHNFYRQQIQVSSLQWSEALTKEAEQYALQLAKTNTFKHSSNRINEGENLWMGTANAYTVKDMLHSWTEEAKDFVYNVFPNCSKNGNVVGHFTQIIWKTTTQVGCAIATNGNNDYLVCRYFPAGNWIGEKPY
ncbi:MAG: hypothetical protein JST29_05000 [Bacteroidetes bacterium]|nr:hypothetical protein [Bacteroidota bacterium]MBS1592033.1 hypothetical protein [Bacteroidota bacterium]